MPQLPGRGGVRRYREAAAIALLVLDMKCGKGYYGPMRSELIGEIFSVETEAERLVSEARQQGRSMVSASQQEGEKQLQKAIEQARAERDKAIAAAQKASAEHLQALKDRLSKESVEDSALAACADRIASSMVDILCMTQLGDHTS